MRMFIKVLLGIVVGCFALAVVLGLMGATLGLTFGVFGMVIGLAFKIVGFLLHPVTILLLIGAVVFYFWKKRSS